jgi:hypothetical protein
VSRGGGPLFIAYVEDFLKNNPPSMKTIVIIDNARGGVPLFSQIGSCQKENQAVASTKPIFSIFTSLLFRTE